MKYFQTISLICQAFVFKFGLDATIVPCEAADGSNVAIIGAGLSGLTSAWFLQKKGYNVTVFEKNSRVGGQILSEVIDGGLGAADLSKGGDCSKGNGNPSELGGVVFFETSGIKDLATELDVPHSPYHSSGLHRTMVKSGRSFGIVIFALLKLTPIILLIELLLFSRILEKYPEIDTPGLFDHDSDLYLPINEFALKNGFHGLAEIITKSFLVPYGYAYFTTMPAAYWFKALQGFSFGFTPCTEDFFYVFPCGFQSFLETVADHISTVHLGVEIMDINRYPNGTIEVVGDDGSTGFFDQIVIASGLNAVSSIMDVSEEEQDLFSRIKTFNYLTSYVKGNFEEDNPLATPLPIAYAFEPNSVEERIDHVNLIFTSSSGSTAVWQILDKDTTVEEATDIMKQDLLQCASMKDTVVQRQELWQNYFPTVSSEDLSDGFQDRVESLQGTRNTYYLDPSLSFHLTYNVFKFAEDLVERKFVNITHA